MKKRRYISLAALVTMFGLLLSMALSLALAQEKEDYDDKNAVVDKIPGNHISIWEKVTTIAQIGAAVFALGLLLTTFFLWLSTRRYSQATENLVEITNNYSEYTKQMAETMREQKKISREQMLLSQKTDEDSKFAAMLSEYNELSSRRKSYAANLKTLYEDNRKYLNNDSKPNSFHELIYEVGPPSPLPSEQDDLQRYIETNQGNWDNLVIWEFLNHIFRDSILGKSDFRENHANIVLFWSKWCMLLDVREYLYYLRPKPEELTSLVWVELINIKNIPASTWPRRILPLFKLAQTNWQWWRGIAITYQDINNL